MLSKCRGCGQTVNPGSRVLRLAFGLYSTGYRPTFLGVAGEWHTRCYSGVKLKYQEAPRRCLICEELLKQAEPVTYIITGQKPKVFYRSLERRSGPYIVHRACLKRDDGPLHTASVLSISDELPIQAEPGAAADGPRL